MEGWLYPTLYNVTIVSVGIAPTSYKQARLVVSDSEDIMPSCEREKMLVFVEQIIQ